MFTTSSDKKYYQGQINGFTFISYPLDILSPKSIVSFFLNIGHTGVSVNLHCIQRVNLPQILYSKTWKILSIRRYWVKRVLT